MRIEKRRAAYAGYCHVVSVAAGELRTASGKTLPYAAYIGCIEEDGALTLWRPAASGIPRDYKPAALKMLAEAKETL